MNCSNRNGCKGLGSGRVSNSLHKIMQQSMEQGVHSKARRQCHRERGRFWVIFGRGWIFPRARDSSGERRKSLPAVAVWWCGVASLFSRCSCCPCASCVSLALALALPSTKRPSSIHPTIHPSPLLSLPSTNSPPLIARALRYLVHQSPTSTRTYTHSHTHSSRVAKSQPYRGVAAPSPALPPSLTDLPLPSPTSREPTRVEPRRPTTRQPLLNRSKSAACSRAPSSPLARSASKWRPSHDGWTIASSTSAPSVERHSASGLARFVKRWIER